MSLPISTSATRVADLPAWNSPASQSATGASGATAESSAAEGGNSRTQAAARLNSSIVQSSLAINASNEPLALVLKSALTGINEQLAPQFGENAIQNAASQDNSPDGTAGRIVSLSTAFFQAFKDKNPGLSDDAAAKKFLDTIKGGIEQGFKEARDILGGLKVLNGDVASNIDKTYDLVQQGLAKFASDHGVGGDGASPPADGGGANASGAASEVSVTASQSSSVTVSAGSRRN